MTVRCFRSVCTTATLLWVLLVLCHISFSGWVPLASRQCCGNGTGKMPVAPLKYSRDRTLGAWATVSPGAPADDLRLQHARRLLDPIPEAKRPLLKTDASLGHPEAFSIQTRGSRPEIVGGSPAGVLYGVQQWLASPQTLSAGVEKPDFELRGTVLFLMKDGSYDYQLEPGEFPWFYDRPLLTKYLDYLFANRFNTIFLWSGHLFPSIVSMPEYPDATDLSPEQLARNQEQFRWFTRECARRNISVLLHFYQIHLPKPLAKARGIPVRYRKPNEFAARFVRYSLQRFLTEFDSVGLYVCPGEALRSKYQPEWIRDVIIAAARRSGKNPPVVVRDWTLDAKRFKQICVGQYDNLYTELKHNVEMIVSPVPNPRHAKWKNVAKKHIVNLHEIADVKPFRWGSPLYIREMVGEWKKIGLDGAEVYGMVSWRWPYALDKLEPEQSDFWPEGPKLLTFERDAIWLEAVGRYLWKVNRPENAERAYWTTRLGEQFGSKRAGESLLEWYNVTGPVLPGLQNLTHVRNMNYYPTAVGKEQRVDAILDTKKCDANYPARPVDSYFFDRYKKKYNLPELTNRIPMPVATYAEKLAAGQAVTNAMTPDRVAALLVEMAEEGLHLAEPARAAATKNQEEAARFVTDSRALVLVAKAWREKVLAAVAKRAFQKTGQEKYAQELREHLRQSVAIYEKLVALTDTTYVNATDMRLQLNWHKGLEAFRADRQAQEQFLHSQRARKAPSASEGTQEE